ncbi:triphosphoribosyl-dephospho-CoA synthase, partial [Salmonella enterica subsp. enterica serovar Cerro]|nr:triphosphoribosyl-dephospho-CoA synthase [Salmonella enterica subsp. enterica serovar Cerro]
LLHQGGIRTPDDLVYLHRFDQQCIERNLSPGGSADLLIVTWFGFFAVIAIAAGISALLLLPFLNAQAPRETSEA